MTYSQIFKELYRDHKKFFRVYVIVCIIFSVLLFGNGNYGMASSMDGAKTVATLGGDGGQIVYLILQTLGRSVNVSINAPITLTVCCAISAAFEVMGRVD